MAQIENDILLDGLRDLRIHFGINCASVSCVDLLPAPYRAEKLYQQLESQGSRFLADQNKGMRIDVEQKKILLSQVFKFDKRHFDALEGGALKFILPFRTARDRALLLQKQYQVDYLEYDWKANDAKNVLPDKRGPQ